MYVHKRSSLYHNPEGVESNGIWYLRPDMDARGRVYRKGRRNAVTETVKLARTD